MSTPSVVAREYNPTNGAFIGNITSLSFGNVPVGNRSPVKVIDLAFVGVDSVSNVKLALLTSGTLMVNDNPSSALLNANGSDVSGYFGISTSSSIAYPCVPTTYFRGTYDSEAEITNSVSIPLRDADNLLSQFIYLDIQLRNDDRGPAGGSYRVLFDYV